MIWCKKEHNEIFGVPRAIMIKRKHFFGRHLFTVFSSGKALMKRPLSVRALGTRDGCMYAGQALPVISQQMSVTMWPWRRKYDKADSVIAFGICQVMMWRQLFTNKLSKSFICYVKHRISYNRTMHFFLGHIFFCVDVFMVFTQPV